MKWTKVWPTSEGWHSESTLHHGHNVLGTILVSGRKRTPIIGVYLPPSDLDSLPEFEAVLAQFPGLDPIVLGDLNVDLMRSSYEKLVQYVGTN